MSIKIPTCPYVYTLSDPDGVIFYIGKGRNKRLYHHEMSAKRGKPGEKHDRIRLILESGGKIQYQIISTHKTDVEACLAEVKAIAAHDNLTNLTKGGEPGGGDASSKAAAIRRAKALLAKIKPYEAWVNGMSDERKAYLVRISGGESLESQRNWIVKSLLKNIEEPRPDWVAEMPDGTVKTGFGNPPGNNFKAVDSFLYSGADKSWHFEKAEVFS